MVALTSNFQALLQALERLGKTYIYCWQKCDNIGLEISPLFHHGHRRGHRINMVPGHGTCRKLFMGIGGPVGGALGSRLLVINIDPCEPCRLRAGSIGSSPLVVGSKMRSSVGFWGLSSLFRFSTPENPALPIVLSLIRDPTTVKLGVM